MNREKSPKKEVLLFSILIFLEVCRTLYVALTQRIGIHETFDHFSLVYFFLNNKIMAGELPQWIPYLTHGRSTFMYYAILGISGFIYNSFYYLSGVLKYLNFVQVFNLGIFLEKLLLLLGIWLLSKRYFSSSYTSFFVTSCVMGSCIWMTQPHFNFYMYYSFPMILYLCHRFIDTGQWRYCFLSFNLLIIQTAGNVAYLIPIITLVIFLYFLFYYFSDQKYVHQRIKDLRFGKSFFVCAGLLVLSFIPVLFMLQLGKGDDIAIFTRGRQLSGEVGLNTFLLHGGNTDLRKWLELFLGVSPAVDYNLYIGLLPLPLAVLGALFNPKKENFIFISLIVSLTLFTMASWFTILLYHLWPLMKFFRHIALVSPIVKIFLCFLAGFGFETLFIKKIDERFRIYFKYLYITLTLTILTHSLVVFVLCRDHSTSFQIVFELIQGYLPHLKTLFHGLTVYNRLFTTSLFSFILFILFSALPYLKSKYDLKHIITLFLIFHVMDIYSYAFSETNLRTVKLSQDQYEVTRFERIPYNKRRRSKYEGDTDRERIISEKLVSTGIFNWQVSAFLYKDTLHTPLRVDHWGRPLDQLMRAYWGQSINDRSSLTASIIGRKLEFPTDHPSALKVTGVSEDKIQFFSDAFLLDSEKSVASYINHPKYKGDILFLSPLKKASGNEAPSTKNNPEKFIASNSRLKLPYKVVTFNANHIIVSVNNPNDANIWMYYSDVWYPSWKATVNDKPAEVFKANLAYKAVALNPGENTVHFYFVSKALKFMHAIIGLNAFFWILLILFFTKNILFDQQKKDPFIRI